MNRRSFLKYIFGSILTLLGLSGGTYVYAREIEPTLLDETKQLITSKNIPKSFDGFKIVQFSDTHIDFQYSLKQFKKLVETMNQMQPDLIVFTGDLVDKPQHFQSSEALIAILRELKAKYGKLWVYGNHDHGGYGTEMIQHIMDRANFTLLKNSHTVLEINNDRILIAGIDDAILGLPDVETALEQTNKDLYTILLAHEPDVADTTVKYPVDVQLSGHSHGGQVRLPFVGHLYTPALSEKYIHGKYLIDDKLALYVNRGIGTTRLPFRFLCKPELSIYTLKHDLLY